MGFWHSWLAKQNQFCERIMGDVGHRHFDITLLNKLAGLGQRNQSSIANFFCPYTGVETTSSPFPGRYRSKDLLKRVSDQDYRKIYDNLMEDENMSFPLMSKYQFSQFKQHNVTALRSSMDQVLRWLVPAGDFVLGASRYAPERDLRIIFHGDHLAPCGYSPNIIAADNLINLVA